MRDNITALEVANSKRSKAVRWWRIAWRDINRRLREAVEAAGIIPPDPEQRFWQFSGGNQQKAVAARCLNTLPQLLVMIDPTLGVDVAARFGIHNQIRSFRSGGGAVLLASADLDELATLADRVLVLRDGVISAELAGPAISKRALEQLVIAEPSEPSKAH